MPKLKTTDEGAAVLTGDGEVIVVMDDGDEVPTNVLSLREALTKASNESAGRRKKIEDLEGRLKPFEDFDLEAAREAMQKVKDLDSGKLVEAGKVEELRKQVAEELKGTYEPKLGERDEQIEKLRSRVRSLQVGRFFASSKALEETIFGGLPEAAEAYFGQHFRVNGDGDQPEVFWDPGSFERPVMSQKNPGDIADPDEALSLLIAKHPNRKAILASNGATGGGAEGGAGDSGTGTTMSRPEFDRLDPQARQKFIRKGGKVTEAAAG